MAAAHPVDGVPTMRESARRLLVEGAPLPATDELAKLTVMLREHMELLIPEVAVIAGRLPKDDTPPATARWPASARHAASSARGLAQGSAATSSTRGNWPAH
jgi:hypothetical protein